MKLYRPHADGKLISDFFICEIICDSAQLLRSRGLECNRRDTNVGALKQRNGASSDIVVQSLLRTNNQYEIARRAVMSHCNIRRANLRLAIEREVTITIPVNREFQSAGFPIAENV